MDPRLNRIALLFCWLSAAGLVACTNRTLANTPDSPGGTTLPTEKLTVVPTETLAAVTSTPAPTEIPSPVPTEAPRIPGPSEINVWAYNPEQSDRIAINEITITNDEDFLQYQKNIRLAVEQAGIDHIQGVSGYFEYKKSYSLPLDDGSEVDVGDYSLYNVTPLAITKVMNIKDELQFIALSVLAKIPGADNTIITFDFSPDLYVNANDTLTVVDGYYTRVSFNLTIAQGFPAEYKGTKLLLKQAQEKYGNFNEPVHFGSVGDGNFGHVVLRLYDQGYNNVTSLDPDKVKIVTDVVDEEMLDHRLVVFR